MALKQDDTFLVFSLQSWDLGLGSNCVNIAQELSKHHKVVYFNNPLDYNTLLRKRSSVPSKYLSAMKSGNPIIEEVQPNLFVVTPSCLLNSINSLPAGRIFNYLLRKNNNRLARDVQKVLKELGIRSFHLFNDSNMFRAFHLREMLNAKGHYYYSRDNLMAVPYWKKHGQYLEPRLSAKSEICFANSQYLQNILKQSNPNSLFVGQGCDFSIWNHEEEYNKPIDLPTDQKIIGYVGALYELRLDISLIEAIAQAFPEQAIVLIGPEDEAFKKSALHGMKNVFFPGQKKPTELPAYVRHFDVCMNPQLVNEVTIGNYPRKIDEFLALGKPVVATKTDGMSLFESCVSLAENKQQFIDFIAKALENPGTTENIKKRINLALSHSWENSVKEILTAISKTA